MKRPRLQTNYSLHRVPTGRLSSGVDDSDLDKVGRKEKVAQVQNIPKKLRDTVVPDPGYVMLGADWAAIQWALAMWEMSKLPGSRGFHLDLLDRFQAGEIDPHRYLASVVEGCPQDEVTPAQRTAAKPYTFGRLFFGAPRTLAREAGHKDAIGVRVCKAHSTAFRPEEWWAHLLADVKKRKYIQTPLGWRQWFWDYNPKPTEVYAGLIQALEADLLKWTLRQVEEDAFDWEFLTTTHDSLLFQVLKEQAERAKSYLVSILEQPVPWLGNRTWRVDAKLGMSWKEVS